LISDRFRTRQPYRPSIHNWPRWPRHNTDV